jgi:hypothetical protein
MSEFLLNKYFYSLTRGFGELFRTTQVKDKNSQVRIKSIFKSKNTKNFRKYAQ